ncbi:MAG TPA: hypothetical protein DEO91_20125, partial [Pseudomonas sp.]|nr:hypothetical protein [Pseudomonas sp.]
MKITLNRIALATCLALGATAAQANDNFVGLTWGQTDNNIQKSNALNANLGNPKLDKVINGEGTWGIRAGQKTADSRYYATYENVSDSHNGYKLRQQNLLGSYDMFVPLGDNNTKLLGGVTGGLVKLEQESRGFSGDSDIGFAAGLLDRSFQDVKRNLPIEAGYRYRRSKASTDMAQHGAGYAGSWAWPINPVLCLGSYVR